MATDLGFACIPILESKGGGGGGGCLYKGGACLIYWPRGGCVFREGAY